MAVEAWKGVVGGEVGVVGVEPFGSEFGAVNEGITIAADVCLGLLG